jgi:hypothetical protein
MKFLKVVCLLAVIGVLLNFTFCNGDTSETSREAMNTMARKQGKNVKATPYKSTPIDLMNQIPGQPKSYREGELRVCKWEYPDGSAIVVYFTAKKKVGEGLVFYTMLFE